MVKELQGPWYPLSKVNILNNLVKSPQDLPPFTAQPHFNLFSYRNPGNPHPSAPRQDFRLIGEYRYFQD